MAEDLDGVGQALHDWLATREDLAGEILELLNSPLLQPLDGISAGFVLQAALRYALDGAEFMDGVKAEDVALLALDAYDSSLFSSRALLVGMTSLGSELPGSLLGEWILRVRGTNPAFNDVDSQRDRLTLLTDWAKNMGPDGAMVLEQLAFDPESSLRVRAGGVLGLMNRDWRLHGTELAQLFRTMRDSGMACDTGPGYLLMTNLSGTDLSLPGRDRFELLRSVIGDELVGNYALSTLPQDMLRELSVYSTPEDRAWKPYRGVEFAGHREAAVAAGHSLLEGSRDNPNVAVG